MSVPVALGLRAVRGGAATVAVAREDGEPRVVLSTFLATAAPDDRLAFEPYHVAAEMAAAGSGDVAAAVAEGRGRQEALASEHLASLLERLRGEGFEPATAALLINRAGWITDLLSYSLAMADHPPVAEGLAVREALRTACARRGVAVTEMDEKALPQAASAVLGLGPADLEPRLKALGASVGAPWRREQKLAALAAWLALATP